MASESKRDKLNTLWLELVDQGYEIDLGSKWARKLQKKRFGLSSENRTDLRYGVADRVGYELLQRPVQRTVLARHATGEKKSGRPKKGGNPVKLERTIAVVDEMSAFNYEPVPIETVLWDGQASSSSSQAPRVGDSDRPGNRKIYFDDETESLTPITHVEPKPSPKKRAAKKTAAKKSVKKR